MTEIVEEQFALADYRIKVQAKQFWDFLAGLQRVRCRPTAAPSDQPD